MRLRHFVSILFTTTMLAASSHAGQIKTVFYIDMENHNRTDPNPSGVLNGTQVAPAQLMGNVAAPYLNSLMTPGNPNATQTSWASNYKSVLANTGQHIHPSEPNYLWQEGGSNFGVLNDASVATNSPKVGNAPSLSGALQAKGISWKSYQEGIDLLTTIGKNGTAGDGVTNGAINGNGSNLTNTVAPKDQWSVPLVSLSGTSADYVNPYNGSHQYNFATKHDGHLFFDATNGITDHSVNGGVTTNAVGTGTQDAANPLSQHYAPLEQLTNDLNNNTVSRYNQITPDQFNDMHSALNGGFTYNGTHFTSDQAAIAQGDNFLSIIVPQIMASKAYQDGGAIVIWFDESERTGVLDALGNPVATDPDATGTTITEIVISKLAKGNGFQVDLPYNHDSDLLTLEELFGLGNAVPRDPRDIGKQYDLSAMFQAGAIPEPATWAMLLSGLLGFSFLSMRRRRS